MKPLRSKQCHYLHTKKTPYSQGVFFVWQMSVIVFVLLECRFNPRARDLRGDEIETARREMIGWWFEFSLKISLVIVFLTTDIF